jgi:hypothetical protein|tara:strand:+ start:132 stop:401 length:270 start_codon:yes stop_codon:yes gene_type:complete
MKVIEIVLRGFYGGTDETDHLIVWVSAEDMEAVAKVADHHTEKVQYFSLTDLPTGDGGIDYFLPRQTAELHQHLRDHRPEDYPKEEEYE